MINKYGVCLLKEIIEKEIDKYGKSRVGLI
jgi:hypothetical protein